MHELKLETQINASPEKVFEAWTTRTGDWWGPHGMTCPKVEMDLRSGGQMDILMRAPDGTEYPMKGTFLEVSKERIVGTDAFGPNWEPIDGEPFMVSIYEFESKDGGTHLTARALHWTEENKVKHEGMGFYTGWGEMLERLKTVSESL